MIWAGLAAFCETECATARILCNRISAGSISAPAYFSAEPSVSATLQPTARPDRAGVEAHSAPKEFGVMVARIVQHDDHAPAARSLTKQLLEEMP
jgi:hypothetical protein